MNNALHHSNTEKNEPRRFLGIHFRCCNIYQRIYPNKQGTAYEGRCPRCGKQVHVPIGQNGVSTRFFEAR